MKLPTDVIIHYESSKKGTSVEWHVVGELIHCRDCKHRMHDGTCIKVMKRKPDDGFCDEGESNEW